MKYFDLSKLNARKQHFDYGPIEIGNISPTIKIRDLKKKHLKMSAREMMCFINFLPLMMDDLVPHDDEVWKYLVNMIELIDLVLCFEFSEGSISLLTHKSEIHNKDYIRLFNDTLKPKLHNLVHYPTVIKKSGPLRKIWCFKYETKHREFKVYAHAITSRRNICLTLAKKFEFKFSNQLFELKNPTCYTPYDSDKITSEFINIVSAKLNVAENILVFYSSVEYNGVKYKNGYYVAKYENDVFIYIILNIILLNNSNVMLFCQQLKKINYIENLISYEIDPLILGPFSILSMKDLLGPPINISKTSKGQIMLRLKEFYKNILN